MKNGIKSLAIWLILIVILIVVISSVIDNSNSKMTYSELIENIDSGNAQVQQTLAQLREQYQAEKEEMMKSLEK